MNQDLVQPILQGPLGLRTSVLRTIPFGEGKAILGKSSFRFLLLPETFPPALPLDLYYQTLRAKYLYRILVNTCEFTSWLCNFFSAYPLVHLLAICLFLIFIFKKWKLSWQIYKNRREIKIKCKVLS